MTFVEDDRWFLRGLATQFRTIGALILRETHTRFGRDNIGYLWLFVEPGSLATGVAGMHIALNIQLPPGMQVASFYLAGYTPYSLFRSIVSRAATAVEANGTLLYHKQVTLLDLVLSRAILDFFSTLTAAVLLLGLAQVLGLGQLPAHPLRFLEGWGLCIWFSTALSMLILSGSVYTTAMERFVQPAIYLLMPLSNAFTVFEQLSPEFRSVLEWVPMAQYEEIVREGLFDHFQSQYSNATYVVYWCLGLTLAGLLALRRAREKVEFE